MTSLKAFLTDQLMFRVVQVGVVLSLLVGLGISVQVHNLTNCLADYNTKYAAASQARSVAFERGTEAEDEMWLAFADAQRLPPDEARRVSTDAFNKYVAARRTAHDERQSHPLPAPPSKVCR